MVTDHSNGGYNMDDSAIGVFITIGASFSFFYQVRCQAHYNPSIAACWGLQQ